MTDNAITEAIDALGDAAGLAENFIFDEGSQAAEFRRAATKLSEYARGLGPIYTLRGDALRALTAALQDSGVYEVSLALDGGVKFKVNQGSWTPPLGEVRP